MFLIVRLCSKVFTKCNEHIRTIVVPLWSLRKCHDIHTSRYKKYILYKYKNKMVNSGYTYWIKKLNWKNDVPNFSIIQKYMNNCTFLWNPVYITYCAGSQYTELPSALKSTNCPVIIANEAQSLVALYDRWKLSFVRFLFFMVLFIPWLLAALFRWLEQRWALCFYKRC